MRRRALLILLAAPLAACAGQFYGPANLGASPGGAGPGAQGRPVAALLPLTGRDAPLGQGMLQAVQLALAAPGAPPLDVEDTGSTPQGAAAAARTAVGKGAGLFIGPLTAAETSAVAPVAQAANVPVLALTSDPAQARPGVWTLGLTPAQQVSSLVQAVQAEGKTRLAAVLPQGPFGDALAGGLTTAATEAGLPQPNVKRYAPNSARSLSQALKDVSDYATRHPPKPATPAAPASPAPAGAAPGDQPPPAGPSSDPSLGQPAPGEQRTADATSSDPLSLGAPPAAAPEPPLPPPPVPFDALLLGAGGPDLGRAAAQLAPDDIGPSQVRVLGPATWDREAARVPALASAWYAAPDPATRKPFEAAYAARYGAPPSDPRLSNAYDAAGLARAATGPAGFDPALLVRPEGFAGADGVFTLLPDGRVRRGLAIFEVQPSGPRLVQPAPQSLAAPSS